MREDLADGGRQLLDELTQDDDPFEVTALIVEAARMKDRLDCLHQILIGDEELWLRLIPSRGDTEVLEIRVDSAAQEARQLATVFRQMLAEIERRRAGDGDSDSGEGDDLAGL
ncbi:hypothetical protein GS894_02995 [Rhodococcus hoagii]|nr:hypothetical protein [Prescottella equi]NKS06728.1 hypothetical protein [Prescottella equi]NKT07384.1 hypothetical protein [Prescottella equi]NKT31643.1 hypothetical protein [Prescottella equi]NKT39434.1 hypothetical protein [Prescottella equi]